MSGPQNEPRFVSDLLDLSGRLACVTGAGRGLGRMHALALAQASADLVLIDLEGDTLASVVQEVAQLGCYAETHVGSVDDAVFIDGAIGPARGDSRAIDILVNNAGVSGQYLHIEDIRADHLETMLRVHVVGAFNCTQAVVPAMKRQRSGRIINTASTWGLVGHDVSSHYCAVKAALIGATKAWAKELASHGICVNAIAPGWIDTNKWTEQKRDEEAAKIPLRRMGTPEEIAVLVAYLASPAAGFISGQVISPNGAQAIT